MTYRKLKKEEITVNLEESKNGEVLISVGMYKEDNSRHHFLIRLSNFPETCESIENFDFTIDGNKRKWAQPQISKQARPRAKEFTLQEKGQRKSQRKMSYRKLNTERIIVNLEESKYGGLLLAIGMYEKENWRHSVLIRLINFPDNCASIINYESFVINAG
jgi:hypothetical protein